MCWATTKHWQDDRMEAPSLTSRYPNCLAFGTVCMRTNVSWWNFEYEPHAERLKYISVLIPGLFVRHLFDWVSPTTLATSVLPPYPRYQKFLSRVRLDASVLAADLRRKAELTSGEAGDRNRKPRMKSLWHPGYYRRETIGKFLFSCEQYRQLHRLYARRKVLLYWFIWRS